MELLSGPCPLLCKIISTSLAATSTPTWCAPISPVMAMSPEKNIAPAPTTIRCRFPSAAPSLLSPSPPSVREASLNQSSGPLLFNPAAYAAPQGLTFGDVGRNSLNIPSRLNFDMALYKNFPIKESYSFQFRAEAFNIFNHTQWNGVNSSIACYGATNNAADS